MAATAFAFDPSNVPPAGNAPDWGDPEPLPDGRPGVAAFDLALLPTQLAPWVEDLCERMQIPADFPAAALMVEAGSIIGRQVAIRPKRCDDWLVVANLFGMVVGRPGLLKTPALREALGAVHALEAAAKREYAAALREYEAEMKIWKVEAKLADKDIEKALKGNRNARDQLARQLAEGGGAPEKPVRRRHLVNDATVEKLGEILRDNPVGVLNYRDELSGFLRGMERDGHEQDRAFYLEAWDGAGRFTYDRIGRGTIDIGACVVSIIGAVCPGPLQSWISSRAAGGEGDDGLLQRFQVAVWPDNPGEYVNVDRAPDPTARQLQREALERLRVVGARVSSAEVFEWGPPARDDDDDDDRLVTQVLRFDAEAQDLFDAWRVGLERKLRASDLVPAWESHLSKYRSLLPSIALICHLIDGHTGAVGAEAWLRAEAWAEYLESHARRIFDAFLRPHAAPAHALAAKLLAAALPTPFRLKDVYRPQWSGLTTRAEAELAVETLLDAGWLAAEDVIGAIGRPGVVYHINPKCKDLPR
jgi:hypothetical protein